MRFKRIVAFALAVSALVLPARSQGRDGEDKPGDAEPARERIYYDRPADKVKKTETVYVNLNLNGGVEKINVVDWLRADGGGGYIDDVSDLKNIVNLKDDVEPIINGEKIRWRSPGEDVYYGGETDKKPPVSFEIKYFLNGKNANPEELAGKSGKIAVSLKAINRESKEVSVNGKKRKVFLPVLTVGGMVLPEDDFTEVRTTNGGIIGDGSKKIVVFAGAPGFAESFGSGNDKKIVPGGFEIPDETTVEFRTENFSLGNIYLAAFPLDSLNLSLKIPESVKNLKNALEALKDVRNALDKIDPDRAILRFISDKEKMRPITETAADFIKLYNENENLIRLTVKYATPENAAAVSSSLETLGDPNVLEALELLSDPVVQNLLSKLPAIAADFEAAAPILSELAEALRDPEIQNEIARLPETAKRLSNIVKVVEENSETLNALTAALSGGGSGDAAASLLEKLSQAGAGEGYAAAIDFGDEFTAAAEEALRFGSEYGLFTRKAEGTESSLAFVYRTPSIKKRFLDAERDK